MAVICYIHWQPAMDNRSLLPPVGRLVNLTLRGRIALAIGLACALAVVIAGLTARWGMKELINSRVVDHHFSALADDDSRPIPRQGGRGVAGAAQADRQQSPPLKEQDRALVAMFDRALLIAAPVAAVIIVLLSMLLSHRLSSAHEQLKDSARSFSDQASKLRELSIRDDLTGLYNRRHFNQQVKTDYDHALRNNCAMCLVMVDIDCFKQINDSYGHAVGDAVLRCIGTLFGDNIRSGDIAARIGGEEFVIAFPETSIGDAGAMCERLRQMVSDYPWDTIAEGLAVTISMGLFGGAGFASCDDMLRIADRNLYRAKASGRNRLVVCQ